MSTHETEVGWLDAQKIAESTGSTVAQVQDDARTRAIITAVFPRRASALEGRKDQLSDLQQAVEQEEQSNLALAREWNSLLGQRDKLRSEVSFARDQVAYLEAALVEKTAWIQNALWGTSVAEPPNRIPPYFVGVVALKEAIASGKLWIPRADARLKAVEGQLAEFAHKYGIKLQ